MKIDFKVSIKRRNGFHLNVSEACATGSLGIVGPSGSGKSTLLDALVGHETGKLSLNQKDLTRLPIEKRALGYVTQNTLLFPHLTVRQNLLYSPRSKTLDDIPDRLGISHLLDRMPGKLSGGESRRVALARAILSRPDLLLLDEPFAGLDENARRDAMWLLDRLNKALELPMILVSHSADEIVGLTQWAIRLDAGSVVARGPSESILRQSETRIDNYLQGKVTGPGNVRVGELELSVLLPDDVTGSVRLAVYAHDILLANYAPEGISARNVFKTKIMNATELKNATLFDIEPNLRVLITKEASVKLGLRPGKDVFAILKASSIAYLGPQN